MLQATLLNKPSFCVYNVYLSFPFFSSHRNVTLASVSEPASLSADVVLWFRLKTPDTKAYMNELR